MTLRPCIQCGEPSPGTRCSPCRGYDSQWERLSKKARRMQSWCTDCRSTENLQLDHLPSAWERKAKGLRIRLGIDAEVVCGPCNTARGQARPEPQVLQQYSRSKGGGMPRANAQVGPPSQTPSYTPPAGIR